MNALTGKVVLVAGASSGMGRAIAIGLARAGATVVAVGRREAELSKLHEHLAGSHPAGMTAVADVRDPEQIDAVVAEAVEEFGRLDAAVNCVGVNIPERALDQLTLDSWHSLIESNLTAAFALTRAVVPQFRQQNDGLIIHVASAAVKKPDMSGVGYQAAKAGVAGLAHGTMEEERHHGIRVSVVYPGLTDTPLVDRRPTPVPADVRAKAMQPEDVAALCITLIGLPARAYVPEVSIYPALLA